MRFTCPILLYFGVLTVIPIVSAEEDQYYNIGSIHHKVSSKSDTAQQWFDRGLAMCFAFNHEEAIRCFESAIAEDSSMAMAYWGMVRRLTRRLNREPAPTSTALEGERTPHQTPVLLTTRIRIVTRALQEGLQLAIIDALASQPKAE